MKITTVQNHNPITLGRWALCLLILGLSFSERSSAAVTYVGSETGLPGNDYSVQNWSYAGVAKTWNVSASEVYGSSGYYQIRPTPYSSPTDLLSEAAAAGNNLGATASNNSTLLSAPSFLASVTGGAGTFENRGPYSTYRGPDGSSLVRIGALSVAVNNGPYDSPAGANASYFGIAMSFTLNTTANFRLGLAVDSVGTGHHGPGIYSPNYVSVGGVFSDALTRDGNADMVFFDISGVSGNTFDVALWQNTGTQSVASLSLATFDAIPDPSTALLALVGMGCLAIHSRRRR
jgi:hypothetical protein